MTRSLTTAALLSLLAACGAPDPEVCDLLSEMDESSIVERNGLAMQGVDWNALSFNALSFNALTFNALSFNGVPNGFPHNGLLYQGASHGRGDAGELPLDELTVRALTTDGRAASEATEAFVRGDYGATLLGYAARCALGDDQAVDVSVGAEVLTFRGSLGLATTWTERGLDDTEERRLTACLLAHTNHWALPVPISLRGEEIGTTEAERVAFGVYEGTFFGSLRHGELYSCQGEAFDDAVAGSPDRTLRVCTDGEETCGFTSVGLCEDACGLFVDGEGWTECAAGGDVYGETLSVHLRDGAVVHECAR